MNGTRVMDEMGEGVGRSRRAAGSDAISVGGERVLGSHPFTTARGDRGHVVLLAGSQGLIMVQRVELTDGAVLEWTRALRSTPSLVRCLRGVILTGNANAAHSRLTRLADEHFARTAGV